MRNSPPEIDRKTMLEAIKFTYSCFREDDYMLKPMSDNELKVFFATLAGLISGMSSIIGDNYPKLHAVLENSLETLSLR